MTPLTAARLQERGRALGVLLAAPAIDVERLRRLDAEVRSGRRSEALPGPPGPPAEPPR